jgi:long-chain acyl-CoA synthetase
MRVDDYVAAVAAEAAGTATLALLHEHGEQLTYGQLEQRIAAAAAAWRRAGLAPGERAMLVGENTIDMVVALLGAIRAGGWAVPLNARMSPGEIDGIHAHCEPRVAYFSQASEEAVAHAQRLQARATDDPALAGGLVAVAGAQAGAGADAGAGDVALMIYTSGSTGRPKGVMLTHGNMEFITRASRDQKILGPGDRIFHALPISHSFGLITMLLCALRAGATLHLCTRFAADKLAHAILHDGVTVFQGVPAMYARLVEWAGQTRTAITPNSLRLCYIGGSQIDPTKKREAEALLGLPLHHGYGLTESGPSATRTIGHAPPREVTAGWPIPGIAVELRGDDGCPVPAGTPGEVCIRGPNVMKGYFRDPDQTRAAIDAEGWLHTGDLGRFGPEGDLHIVGRIKEMIIRGGFNVYPAEVEIAIAAFPGIAQCAVLGHAVDGDEEIVGFLEPMAGGAVDTKALEEFLRGRLAPYKIPRRWHVMDRLPASGTGKLLKPALRPLLGSAA